MPYLPTAQVFLEQSRLLISARPATTRISTKYTLPNASPSPSKYKPKSTSNVPEKLSSPTTSPSPENTQSQPLQATLTLKTYDAVSGVCLKYKTEKAAEVGRLVAALGNCGRVMAALPEKEEGNLDVDEVVKDEVDGNALEGKGKGPLKEAGKEAKGGQSKGGEKEKFGGAGGGKKKKGKR